MAEFFNRIGPKQPSMYVASNAGTNPKRTLILQWPAAFSIQVLSSAMRHVNLEWKCLFGRIGMTRYMNKGGDSNIFSYEIGQGYIDVVFNGGAAYRYSVASVGASNLQAMIELAQAGEGLNSFINRKVKKLYEARLQ